MMKMRVEMASLRQTCCLGLPSRVLMPHILQDVQKIVMSDRTRFAWSDRQDSNSPVQGDFQHHPDHFQMEFGPAYQPPFLRPRPIRSFRSSFGREALSHDRRTFRESGQEHSLSAVVRHHDGPLGIINLHRPTGDPDFTAEDEGNLAQTLPYIAHAICHEIKTPDSYVDSGDAGLMVFDSAGELTFQSRQARELCPYLLAENLTDSWDEGPNTLEMQSAQHALFDRVAHGLAVRNVPVDPPAWTVSNKWGEFHVQAYALLDSHDLAVSYGVIVKKKVPIEVWLLQRIKAMPLSTKQSEICFLLARGVDTADIATQLCITQPTLKDHTQAIYRKLGIRKREELLRLVLS